MADEDNTEDDQTEGTEDGEEEGADGEDGEGSGKKFNAKKIILFVAIPLFLFLGGGAAAYFTGMLDSVLGAKLECENVKEGDENYDACEEAAHKEEKKDHTPGVFVDIPDLIVNLNTATRNPHFLKVSLKVELADSEGEKKLNDVLPRVIDQFQTYLRELRMEDLRGSSGLYRMKIELLNRVQAAAPGVEVRDVLFQEMLVQ